MNKRQLSLSLYINYFIHGFGMIILTQNMQALSHHWQTPLATVSYVVSGNGIGRLLAYFVLGNLSDYFGRKIFINVGMISYFTFFVGMAFVKNIQVAYMFSILSGVAASALDSGTYTTFVEMGKRGGSSNILLKAFISIGEFILPLIISNLESRQMWYGWSFILAAAILVINFVFLNLQTFPERNLDDYETKVVNENLTKKSKALATVGLLGYGYTSMAVMILYTQWISLFVRKTFGFSQSLSHWLLSLYSVGSITGVILIFLLLRQGVAETKLLVSLNALSLLALFVVCYSSVPFISMSAAFLFGFSAAGGVLQIGLNLFIKLYPHIKGRITGSFFTFGSFAAFSIPIITGWLSKKSVANAIRFDLVVCALGLFFVSLTAWALRNSKKEQ
ncbi:MFS transporter [Xylocopilactobacillus apicola]|uniref:MFS transporter n=1 Tax=Xylocopilactobacillus apicola TaxID=2932184 RepID=A0AAU9D9Z5_9LACO|nr:MFS transporter [Xylocopilactobacillus apicola]BDR59195.1 MFS transporter [Xylocopilactobacillus apicola]